MIAASNHHQRKAQHGNAGTFHCGMGRAAPIADGYQSNYRVSSSLPVARTEKLRATCRGQRSPGLFFTPRSTDPDEIHELRICDCGMGAADRHDDRCLAMGRPHADRRTIEHHGLQWAAHGGVPYRGGDYRHACRVAPVLRLHLILTHSSNRGQTDAHSTVFVIEGMGTQARRHSRAAPPDRRPSPAPQA